MDNFLLARLPAADRTRIAEAGSRLRLGRGEVLYEPGERIESVYFPLSCVTSVLTVTRDGAAVESATVGREGLIGLPVFLSENHSGVSRAISQIAGDALRVSADEAAATFRDSRGFQHLIGCYTQALITQFAQHVACNRLHSAEERASRWLLMTHDRIGRKDFGLTHEFLAAMLGVRRATVSEAIKRLQSSGLIESRRGKISVLDRKGLERASCECYDTINQEYERLLEAPEATDA